ncbi:TRAP transporter small permease subunit [Granulosicoccus sp. 3-233]|uniref:TRAP transporter small permease subunit n=1 Tax=Granulosicoccus sp. 3-233 TaxID=3417969 RepID=UPI003D34AA06
MFKALATLQRINEGVAVAAGALLLCSVLVTVYDVFARHFALSLGGTDELSGYAMAISTSWGMCYALTHLAHVRIDLLRSRCQSLGRAMFDLIAILSLTGTAVIIAYRVWPVLSKSIQNNSTANTTLETPLWIPQSLWMAGWVWFAVSALFISLCVVTLILRGQFDDINEIAGLRDEP